MLLAGLLAAAGVVGLLIAVLPRGRAFSNRLSSQTAQTATNIVTVPLTASERREIDDVLDRFVPAAVGRHDPGAAWSLASPVLRAGSTRADWERGDLPVTPYPVHAGATHDWVLLYSLPDTVSVELGLEPAPRANVGNAAFVVTLRRIGGRWRVASIYERAVYPRSGGG
jgi:hypothetical protein